MHISLPLQPCGEQPVVFGGHFGHQNGRFKQKGVVYLKEHHLIDYILTQNYIQSVVLVDY